MPEAHETLEQRAEGLIRQLAPENAKKRVEQAVKRFSPLVRELIRAETGLKLTDGESRGTLPVRVTDGVPKELAAVVAAQPDPMLWRMLALRSRLSATEQTLETLNHLLPELSEWPARPEGLDNVLAAIPEAQFAVALLANLKKTEATKAEIKKIEADILGRYFFPAHMNPRIEIYWMPIALLSQTIDVTIEDLTIVVLIHELAHGYTHIGCDIDGERWDRDAFAGSDLYVKEGLAQHYTAVISKKLEGRAPAAHEAYTRFLELQDGPYLAHTAWLKERPERRGEAVRFALLSGRRDAVTHDDWLALLKRASGSLRNGPKAEEDQQDDEQTSLFDERNPHDDSDR